MKLNRLTALALTLLIGVSAFLLGLTQTRKKPGGVGDRQQDESNTALSV